MKLSLLLAAALAASTAQAFLLPFSKAPSSSISSTPLTRRHATVTVGPASEIPNGERKVVDTEAGAVVVANVGGEFYAVNAKCPHLGLPMKRGAIEVQGGEPTITCNFHKSTFSMKDGVCKKWSESVFGIPGTEGIGAFVGGIGGAKNSPATVYPVTNEDGQLSITI